MVANIEAVLTVNKAILRLLIALARLALEHDRGFASRKTWDAINKAIIEGEGMI